MNNDTPIADLILASCKIAKRQLLDELLADSMLQLEDPEPIHVSHVVHGPSCIPQLNTWQRDDVRRSVRAIIEKKREELL